jgi:hypothetical protein
MREEGDEGGGTNLSRSDRSGNNGELSLWEAQVEIFETERGVVLLRVRDGRVLETVSPKERRRGIQRRTISAVPDRYCDKGGMEMKSYPMLGSSEAETTVRLLYLAVSGWLRKSWTRLVET